MGVATGWDLCSGAMVSRNTVCQELTVGCYKFQPLSPIYLIPRAHAPLIPPMILAKWDSSGSPRKHPTMLGKLDIHPGSLLTTGWTVLEGGPSGCGTCWPEGEVLWSVLPFRYSLLEGLFSREVLQPHPWGSRIFTVMSCLWIEASWSFGEGHWTWEWPMAPSWWCYSP